MWALFLLLVCVGPPSRAAQWVVETVPFGQPKLGARESALIRNLSAGTAVAERSAVLAKKYQVPLNQVIPLEASIRPRFSTEKLEVTGEDLNLKFVVLSERILMDSRFIFRTRLVANDGHGDFAELDFNKFYVGTLEKTLRYHPLLGITLPPIHRMDREKGRKFLEFANRVYPRLTKRANVKIEAIFDFNFDKHERVSVTADSAETEEFLDLMYPSNVCERLMALRFWPTRSSKR